MRNITKARAAKKLVAIILIAVLFAGCLDHAVFAGEDIQQDNIIGSWKAEKYGK